MNQEHTERNAKIAAAYQSGRTLQDIGDEYGMTRERVRQLCKRAGVIYQDMLEEQNREREAEIAWMMFEGITTAAMATKLGISRSRTFEYTRTMQRSIGEPYRKYGRVHHPETGKIVPTVPAQRLITHYQRHGESTIKTAAAFGMVQTGVHRILSGHGVLTGTRSDADTVQEIIRWYRHGVPAQHIAKAFDRSHTGVILILKRHDEDVSLSQGQLRRHRWDGTIPGPRV